MLKAQGGAMTSNEICLRRKDGAPVWLLENVHLVGGGDAPYVLEGTIIDITDRKLAENALRESELRYRTLIERMRKLIQDAPDAQVIIQADTGVNHGRVVEVMEAAKSVGVERLAIATEAQ